MAKRFSLPPPLARPLGRLTARWRRRPAEGTTEAPAPVDPLLEAGRLLRQAREGRGLGLRQLAQDTRISTPVLEAMERGWRDRLPEAAYLRTMLPLLEKHLDLPVGSLAGALPKEPARTPGPARDRFLSRFTPGSIDVFTTWQGTLLYGALILALIYGLNLQQRRLAARGLLSTRPVAPLADPIAADAEDADELLLSGFPELRPLRRAETGQALGILRSRTPPKGPDLSRGVLRLRLETPTRLQLRPRNGSATSLEAARGELQLLVQPPFELQLDPPPPPKAVLWKGQPLGPTAAAEGNAGGVRFRYPVTAGSSSAAPAPEVGEPAGSPRP